MPSDFQSPVPRMPRFCSCASEMDAVLPLPWPAALYKAPSTFQEPSYIPNPECTCLASNVALVEPRPVVSVRVPRSNVPSPPRHDPLDAASISESKPPKYPLAPCSRFSISYVESALYTRFMFARFTFFACTSRTFP